LGEQEVLDKIEDISLHPSKYHQLFPEIPSMQAKVRRAKESPFNNIDQENSPFNPENDK
jgi:hypothetical protein